MNGDGKKYGLQKNKIAQIQKKKDKIKCLNFPDTNAPKINAHGRFEPRMNIFF